MLFRSPYALYYTVTDCSLPNNPGKEIVNNILDGVAVIDLETTGFGSTDRILEIAIIIVHDGKISQE